MVFNYFKKRQKAYRKRVSALILNKNDDVLLVNLESFELRFYAIPGGGVNNGESLEDAVYREIQEELSISKNSLEFIGTCKEPLRLLFKTKKLNRDDVEYDGMERVFFGFCFIGKDSEIVLQPEEIRTYKWVAFSDLKNYLLFDNQLEDTTLKLLEMFPFLADRNS
jgi:putative (di)nucleoside polyphosphate hydrolase